MVTIQLVSDDFSAQELTKYLDQQGVTKELDASIVKSKKEGLSVMQDAVQFVIEHQDEIKLVLSIGTTLPFALKKAYEFVSPAPHILIKYGHGQEQKILYEGKSDTAIVTELQAEINDGEEVRVIFKS